MARPKRFRTPSLLIRSQMLYPVELRARNRTRVRGRRPAKKARTLVKCPGVASHVKPCGGPPLKGRRHPAQGGLEGAFPAGAMEKCAKLGAMVLRLIALLGVMVAFAGNARAGEPTAADRAAIRDVIRGRSRRSAATTARRAFGLASPNIQRMFGTSGHLHGHGPPGLPAGLPPARSSTSARSSS